MPEYLRDPIWQFIGAVLAIGAIAATLIVYRLQKNRKDLTYRVRSSTRVISVGEEIAGKLQITYEGIPITGAQLLVIEIANTGNLPVPSSDWETPITLRLKHGGVICSSELTATNPPNLEIKLKTDSEFVRIQPTLLNSGDSISIKLLITEFMEAPEVEGRIIGVKQIKAGAHASPTSPSSGCLTNFLALLYGIALAAAVFFFPFDLYLAFLSLILAGICFLGVVTIGNAVKKELKQSGHWVDK